MKRLLAVLLLAGASVNGQIITQTFGTGANQFSIDFVEIGNPGNAADTMVNFDPISGTYGSPRLVGSVNYAYNLGKYEISRDMVAKANLNQSLEISLADMFNYGGNSANRPATGITWNEAARFVNWLNTSKGYQAAYNFTTSGVTDNIALWGTGQYSGANQYRHKDAYYFLPSIDEWYKGAYGSPSGDWYDYPTGSNIAPTPVNSGTIPETAIYAKSLEDGPADIMNAGGLSAYGTVGQGGNAWEWVETGYDGTNDSLNELREMRGGVWNSSDNVLKKTFRLTSLGDMGPNGSGTGEGFRVAMVPEPSSLSLLLAGGAVLMAGRRKKSY